MAKNKERGSKRTALRTVMAVRFSALGDVVMTIPVLYSACRCYPDVKFVMLTRPSMTGVFVNAPANLVVEGVDVNQTYSGLGGLRRLLADMVEKHGVDAMVDLHDVLRTKMLRAFCRMRGIPVAKLDKGRADKRALTRRSGKIMLPVASSLSRYRDAFARMGLPVNDCFEGLFGRDGSGDPSLYSGVAPAQRPEGEKWVGIAPFAAHEGKIYPPEKMEEVIARLARRSDVRIFIFGGGGTEKKTAEEWERNYLGVTSLCGKKLGFHVELSLLSHLDVVVSMDSANMHLASVVNTPVVSIWGATHPYCGFTGWHQSDDLMLQAPLPCRPCSVFGNKPCRRHDRMCLLAIRPDAVYAKVEQIIGKK